MPLVGDAVIGITGLFIAFLVVRKTGLWNPDSTGVKPMAGGKRFSGVGDALGRVGSGCGVSRAGETMGVETEADESVG